MPKINEKALKTFFDNSPKARNTYEKICQWDENKTLDQNAESIGMSSTQNAYELAKNYKLKFIKKQKQSYRRLKSVAV